MYSQNENQQNQWNTAMDLISVLSLLVGLVNVQENRQQSAQNDVQAANDKQAEYLLHELKTMFQEQNAMMKEIIEKIDRLEVKNGTQV